MTDDEIVAQVSGEPDLSGGESEDKPDNCPTVSHARARGIWHCSTMARI